MLANRGSRFLSCIAAAASDSSPTLYLKLNQEILQVYATKVALEGQKNLDLVQSILISSLWYYPPERYAVDASQMASELLFRLAYKVPSFRSFAYFEPPDSIS